MEKTKINKEIYNKKNKVITNKKSIFSSFFTSILKFGLAIALLTIIAFFVTAGDVVVDSGNVGIGTTSPATELDVRGDITFGNAGGVWQLDYQSWQGGHDDQANIKYGGANAVSTFGFHGGGVGPKQVNVLIDGAIRAGASSNAEDSYILYGNVGIGTTSPNGKLDILTGSTANIVGLAFTESTTSYIGFRTDYSGSGVENKLKIYSNYASQQRDIMTFKVGGEVGIGTTGPATKLDIDTGSNTLGLRLRGTAETAEIGDIYLNSGGQMIISTVAGTDSSAYIEIRPEDNDYGLILRESDGTGTTPYANFYVTDATDAYLSINVNSIKDGDALVVTAGNKVGIGTTSPQTKLQVDALITSFDTSWKGDDDGLAVLENDAQLYLVSNDAGSWGSGISLAQMDISEGTDFENAWGLIRQTNGDGPGDGSLRFTYGTDPTILDNTAIMVLDNTGNVGIGDTTPTEAELVVSGNICDTAGTTTACASDRRLKENIKPIEDAVDYLSEFKPVEYNFIGEDEKLVGLIAQDIQEVYPELVFNTGDEDYITYNDPGFKYLLIKAIQELKSEKDAEIKQKDKEIQQLTQRISALEAK